jgi:urease accessory protein
MTPRNHSTASSILTARIGLAAAGLLAATPALAHHAMGGETPQTLSQGLLSGLAHPIIGGDHLAFLVVVALLAFALSGIGRWLAPAAFVGGTIAGTLIHAQAVALPAAELLVAASLLFGGALVLSARRLRASTLLVLLAGAGVLHGYAYGESIVGAEQTVLGGYLAGFALVQYSVIAGLVLGLSRLSLRPDNKLGAAIRSGGFGAMAVGGIFLVAGLV